MANSGEVPIKAVMFDKPRKRGQPRQWRKDTIARFSPQRDQTCFPPNPGWLDAPWRSSADSRMVKITRPPLLVVFT